MEAEKNKVPSEDKKEIRAAINRSFVLKEQKLQESNQCVEDLEKELSGDQD